VPTLKLSQLSVVVFLCTIMLHLGERHRLMHWRQRNLKVRGGGGRAGQNTLRSYRYAYIVSLSLTALSLVRPCTCAELSLSLFPLSFLSHSIKVLRIDENRPDAPQPTTFVPSFFMHTRTLASQTLDHGDIPFIGTIGTSILL
jgi:hypothetical protein